MSQTFATISIYCHMYCIKSVLFRLSALIFPILHFICINFSNFYTYFNTFSGINNLYFFTLIPYRV